MPRTLLLSLALAAVAVVLAAAGQAGAQERWRRPLPGGAVAGGFAFERATPYERGRRRGVDFSGPPGAAVVAACTGTVTFAGRVPGRARGRGVTLRCGRLVATELGLSATAVRRGQAVVAGARIGTLGAGPLRLGARVAGDRHGYVDPLALMGDGHAPVAPVAPPAVAPRRRGPGRPPAAVPPVTEPATPRAAPNVPLPALVGAALIASAAGGGGALRARRRRRRARRTRTALVQR
jgi:hypothetical protein